MEFLLPGAAAAFIAVPAILALYFLKVKGAEVRVGSVQFWPRHLADRQANMPWKRLRFSWLLLAQLLVAAILALALMRPGLAGASGGSRTTVVLIDGSPSMLATDVEPNRFQAAVDRVKDMAGDLEPGHQIAVAVLGRHAQLLTNATGNAREIRSALSRARPAGEAANLEEGVSLANSLLAGRPEGSVLLLSDGHMRPPASPPRLTAPWRYESIGSSADNVAIETVGRTASEDIFIRVANLSPAARDVTIELYADDRLVDALPVHVQENSSVEPVWTRLPTGTTTLEARLTPKDDFPLDDRSWLVTAPPTTRRVTLVTKGNGFLDRALRLRPDLEVTVVDPASYGAPTPPVEGRPGPRGAPIPGAADLYVFDGFVPPGPLPQPALLVGPPEGTGAVPVGAPADPGGLLPTNPREPILQYVSLRDVHVLSANKVEPPPDWRTVIAAENGPLLMVHQGEPRLAQVNFDIHQSDLPLRSAFPVLVQNVVSFLLPGGFENQVLPLGQPARLVAGSDATRLDVVTPSGRSVALRPPFPTTLDDTARPGIYTVREARPDQTVTSRFVVQLQDAGQSRIAPGPRPEIRAGSRPAGTLPKGTLEIWPWVLALVLVGLMVEWVVFLRG